MLGKVKYLGKIAISIVYGVWSLEAWSGPSEVTGKKK